MHEIRLILKLKVLRLTTSKVNLIYPIYFYLLSYGLILLLYHNLLRMLKHTLYITNFKKLFY